MPMSTDSLTHHLRDIGVTQPHSSLNEHGCTSLVLCLKKPCDNCVVCFGVIRITSSQKITIDLLITDPNMRSQRLGHTMMRAIEQLACLINPSTPTLSVISVAESRAVFNHWGFDNIKQKQRRPSLFNDPHITSNTDHAEFNGICDLLIKRITDDNALTDPKLQDTYELIALNSNTMICRYANESLDRMQHTINMEWRNTLLKYHAAWETEPPAANQSPRISINETDWLDKTMRERGISNNKQQATSHRTVISGTSHHQKQVGCVPRNRQYNCAPSRDERKYTETRIID